MSLGGALVLYSCHDEMMKSLLFFLPSAMGSPADFVPRKLQTLPEGCAAACPTMGAYYENLFTLINATTGDSKAYNTGILKLWCSHREAVSCGFQETECRSQCFFFVFSMKKNTHYPIHSFVTCVAGLSSGVLK